MDSVCESLLHQRHIANNLLVFITENNFFLPCIISFNNLIRPAFCVTSIKQADFLSCYAILKGILSVNILPWIPVVQKCWEDWSLQRAWKARLGPFWHKHCGSGGQCLSFDPFSQVSKSSHLFQIQMHISLQSKL